MYVFTCEELVPYLHGTTAYQNICCFSCSKDPRFAKSQKFTDIFLYLDNMDQRPLFWAEALQEAPADRSMIGDSLAKPDVENVTIFLN